MRVVAFACAGLLSVLAAPGRAQVDEDRLRLMRETLAYTDVIDAFDGKDRFDLNVRLEYERLHERGKIAREQRDANGIGYAHVADAEHESSRLSLGIDLGLARDLMASIRMPLVLSDARSLDAPAGADREELAVDLAGSPGAPEPLLSAPLASPPRAGLDYLALGAAYALTNQQRKPWLPTWVVRIEGRRALGTVLSPCRDSENGRRCGTNSPEDRDGDSLLDGTFATVGKPGSSRGVSAILLETRFSRRYRHLEPYAGLGLTVEWPSTARDLFPRIEGVRTRPGRRSSAALGAAVIPWENRGTFQRIALDLRLEATHVDDGFDYSPLFDALGSASDPDLARARFERVRVSGEGQLTRSGARVPFTGITHIASHLAYGARMGLEVQAARYIRFQVGSALSFVTSHRITGLSACSDDVAFAGASDDDGRMCVRGRADPRHREVIDAPGKRFVLRDQLLLSLFAQATAMF